MLARSSSGFRSAGPAPTKNHSRGLPHGAFLECLSHNYNSLRESQFAGPSKCDVKKDPKRGQGVADQVIIILVVSLAGVCDP